jgi:hypothetical protein
MSITEPTTDELMAVIEPILRLVPPERYGEVTEWLRVQRMRSEMAIVPKRVTPRRPVPSPRSQGTSNGSSPTPGPASLLGPFQRDVLTERRSIVGAFCFLIDFFPYAESVQNYRSSACNG